VWLHENDEIPCDLVLIGTSDRQGICYVEVNVFFSNTQESCVSLY
jgi:phospholipid-translocating ATPase